MLKQIRNTLLLVLLFTIFYSCSSSYGVIVKEDDTYNNEQRTYVRFGLRGKPLAKPSFSYYLNTELEFRKIENTKSKVQHLIFDVNLGVDQNLDSPLFLKLDTIMYPLILKDIVYTAHKSVSTSESTTVKETKDKDADKNSDKKKATNTVEITNTVEKDESYYNKVSTIVDLSEVLSQDLVRFETINLRYYVDKHAYTIAFSKKQIATIQAFFGNSKK